MKNTIEPVYLLCDTKKAILLYERVFGRTPDASDMANELIQNIQTKDMFANVCNMLQTSLLQMVEAKPLSEEDKNFLDELNYASWKDLYENGDFSLITEEYHHRKFFNEIANDKIIQSLIESFIKLWGLSDNGPYFVEVYDIGDEAIFFNSREEMEKKLNECDYTPYTAFEVKDHCSVELYSE